jgi:hypothetical protein
MPLSLLPLGLTTLWVTVAVCAALVLVLVAVARAVRRSDAAKGGPPVDREPEPLPPADTAAATGLVPPAPAVVGGEAESAEPVLPAIPPDSTEWQEGERLEGRDVEEKRLRSVPELIDALHTGDPGVCDAAIAELTRHGEAAVPALEQALGDEDPDVRIDARRALRAIRGEAG